jgi:hypothetical protein
MTTTNTNMPLSSNSARITMTDSDTGNTAPATEQEVTETSSKAKNLSTSIKGGHGAATGKPAEMDDDLDDILDFM